VPEITIRELVANALIHQDFRMTGASMMVGDLFRRVDISNPVRPIVPVNASSTVINPATSAWLTSCAVCASAKRRAVASIGDSRATEPTNCPHPDFHTGLSHRGHSLWAEGFRDGWTATTESVPVTSTAPSSGSWPNA